MTDPADEDAPGAPQEGPCNVRRKCCGSCAARPGTTTEPSDDLWDLAYDRTATFYCHAGMRPDRALDYSLWDERPDGTPVKADGSPADICAAFWAFRRAAERDLTSPGNQPEGPAVGTPAAVPTSSCAAR